VALIVSGIVLIFVHIPGADLVYSVLGLVIFAGFTLFDFQRVRTSTDAASAPLLAASIFLDIFERVPVLPADLHPGRQVTARARTAGRVP
jgi:FtsH-binding integral membrane protein